jgi:hypothetical protein
MKALTFWQPWGSLAIAGAKPNEFRPESYLNPRSYRNAPRPGDRIVIHAGVRPIRRQEVNWILHRLGTEDDTTGLIVEKARPLLERWLREPTCIPLGAGLGTAVIGKPVIASDLYTAPRAPMPDDSGRDPGAWNWAWPLSDIVPWMPPVPMRGAQGFWTWPGRIAA